MKPRFYFLGIAISTAVLFFTVTSDIKESPGTMHAAAIALSYLVYSSLAFVLTTFGKKKSSKATLFFGCGVMLLFVFLPSLRYLMTWFYIPKNHYDADALRALQDLYFYSPMIVSALCIYRGISFWADESLAKSVPIQTSTANDLHPD
jgi:protein-S-isoprenylcysteine O-methyltransferase Ste14